MSGWRLSLKQEPALRVDARGLQPAKLASLSKAEIERLALPQGRASVALAELFTIERLPDAAGAQLSIDGDLTRFDRLGWCMAEGELHLRGHVGDHAGAGLQGGRVSIDGSAADLAGCAMRGGCLEVSGSVGDLAASALPGEMDGMRGGTFVVRGNAGIRLADRMRRGTVVVFGDAGDLLASRMVAGTLALAGHCGANAAWGMRRGSIVFAGPAPRIAATFAPIHSNADVFWQLLARDLARFGGAFAGLAQRRVQRHAGDLAVLGKGELLLPT
jgi:formylmethanofuran dehydrogenase subunit C